MRRPIEQLGHVQTACFGIGVPVARIALTSVVDNGRNRRADCADTANDKTVAIPALQP